MRPCGRGHMEGRDKQHRCVVCRREQSRRNARKHRLANPESVRESKRKWLAANPGRLQELKRKWRGLPEPARPCPELCEAGCGRVAQCLDHDHQTGMFRGWLCRSCNFAIGQLGDTLEGVNRAAEYLRHAQPVSSATAHSPLERSDGIDFGALLDSLNCFDASARKRSQ